MSFLNLNNKNPKTKSKNDSYVQQAQNIWSMLDDMAASSPKEYKFFDFLSCLFSKSFSSKTYKFWKRFHRQNTQRWQGNDETTRFAHVRCNRNYREDQLKKLLIVTI